MNALWFVLAGCSLAVNAIAGERVVLEGDDDFAPYAYVENGQYKGIYVELLKIAAKKLAPNYVVELRPMPWKRGLKNLESGQSLGLFPPHRHKERAYIDVYSTPLYSETVVIFCNQPVMSKSPKKFPDDFSGLSIGNNLGFLQSAQMIAAVKAKVFTLVENKGNEANLLKLQAGLIDCYVSDRLAAYYSFNKLQDTQRRRHLTQFKDFRLSEAQELWDEEAFIGYSAANTASYKADFIQQMNAALEQVKQAGVLDELIGKAIEPDLPSTD